MSESAFSIFDALSAWGKTLPGWQHFLLTQQPPTEVGGLVTYGLKVRIRVD